MAVGQNKMFCLGPKKKLFIESTTEKRAIILNHFGIYFCVKFLELDKAKIKRERSLI